MNLHVKINETDNLQGNKSAPLTLVEYGDYECPHCGAAYPIVKKLQEYFGDQMLFVFRNFPLTEMHPNALTAAYVAEAAGLQDKFWPVHDIIFENQQNLHTKKLLEYANVAGAESSRLIRDVKSPRVMEKVDRDIEGGARSGVNGTPTFFINGRRYDGYYDFEDLAEALSSLAY